MSSNRDHLDIALASIHCFTDDGKIDHVELDRLLAIAERDGTITDDETRILESVIAKITPEEIDAALRSRIEDVRKRIAR